LRMSQAGKSSYYLATVQCYHAGCGSSNHVKARRLFHSLQSRTFYAFKHLGSLDATTLLLATAFIEPVPRFVHALAKGSLREIQAVAHGYFLFWRAVPGILKGHYRERIVAVRPEFETTRGQ